VVDFPDKGGVFFVVEPGKILKGQGFSWFDLRRGLR
jgi:hypothetical protein